MSIEQNLSSLSVSTVDAVEIMELLGLQTYDLDDPVRFKRFEETVKYLSAQPDYRFFINRITVGKNVDRLNHVFEYSQLQKRKDARQQEYKDKEKQLETLNHYMAENNKLPPGYDEFVSGLGNVRNEISRIEEEMRVYEK